MKNIPLSIVWQLMPSKQTKVTNKVGEIKVIKVMHQHNTSAT